MTDLERDLYRSLADVVVKLELELESLQAITPGRLIPCACDSMRAGPGCKQCLVKRARKVMAEYEAKAAETILRCACGLPREDHDDPDSFEPVPCSECGKPDPDITVQFAFDGTRTATCRTCHTNAREYDREKAGVI